MKYIEWDKAKGISSSSPFECRFHLKGFKFHENKNCEEEIVHKLAESGFRDTLQFPNCSYLSLSERETGKETERATGRGRARGGERMMMSRQLQSGEASGIFQLVEQINNIIVWLKSITLVRSRESLNEKNKGLGVRNLGYEPCLNHFVDFWVSMS